jgi:hypothetical protein
MVGWIIQHVPLEPMESHTPAVISRIQQRGIPILAFTARSKKTAYCPPFDRVTRDQLLSIGVDFTKTSLPKELSLDEVDAGMWGFSYGVVFCPGAGKGPPFAHFLKHYGYRPERIVFVDDRLNMLESMEQAMADEGIPFLGLHYVRPAPAFNLAVANIQWHALLTTGSIPSDDEALKLYLENPERSPNFLLEHMLDQLHSLSKH